MGCFDNIIGIKGICNEFTPTSGLYLNDIGIDIDELNAIVTRAYASGEDLFDTKVSFAIKLITQNIHNHLADKYKAVSVLKGQRLGYFQDNLSLINGSAGNLKGIEVEFCNDHSYVDLFISELSLLVDFTGSVDVKVYDLIRDKLMDTITVATTANKIATVYPFKTYKSSRRHLDIIFVYDSSTINSNKTYLKQSSCTNCGSGSTYSNAYLTAKSVTIPSASEKIKDNLTQVGDTGGMSLVYNLSCNHEDWLCSISNTIGLPILYKTAAEIMEFGIHNSSRTNSNTMIDYGKMKERFDYYNSQFIESFESTMKNIQLPSDERCFHCNQKSKNVIILP